MADKYDYDDDDADLAYFRPNESKYKNHDDLCMRTLLGCNGKEVLDDGTLYLPGAVNQVHDILITFLKLFQKTERASAHFMTDGACVAYEHITRQHVRDIMAVYGPHLKPNASTTPAPTFGEEFHRILSNVALTMKSWK
jgi:hypothetical protein